MSKNFPSLKTWDVIDIHDNHQEIKAHYLFVDEQHGGLAFRYKTDQESYILASYSAQGYASCIMRQPDTKATNSRPEPAPRQRPQPMGRRRPDVNYDDEIPF